MVAVVGLYDKGKTFVLNNLTLSNLPSGKKFTTKGISFKHVNVDSGTNLILVDTAGSFSPVKINNELSIIEKEATEVFITDLVFEIADYFICVVNDFTSLD
jgi:GTPase Era involved in 16S rRNA processing